MTMTNLVNYAGINLLLGGGTNYFYDFVVYYVSSGKLRRYDMSMIKGLTVKHFQKV